jgi:diguanylate cyclase (GGDEF)-like protein
MSLIPFLRKHKSVRVSIYIGVMIWAIISFIAVLAFMSYYNRYFELRQKDVTHVVTSIFEKYELEAHVFSSMIDDAEDSLEETNFQEFTSNLMSIDDTIEYVQFSRNAGLFYVYPETFLDEVPSDIVSEFTLDEFSRFQASISDQSCFTTYNVVTDGSAETVYFHYPLIDDSDEYIGLVTLAVPTVNLLSQIPEDMKNNELVIRTAENVFLYGSEHLDNSFRDIEIQTDHLVYRISMDYRGEYYIDTIHMVIFATFLAIFPVLLILAISIIDKKKINDYITQIEYARSYSVGFGLKNDFSFYEDVENYIRNNITFFVVLSNFNNIKYINDKFGHLVGTELIVKAIKLIQGVLRHNTQMYHLGGSEYVFIIKAEGRPEVVNTLKRVLKIFERDITIDHLTTNISMSMGIVQFPQHGSTADALIKNAHLTLSNSRILNSNGFEFYQKENVNAVLVNQDFDQFVKHLNLELFEVYLMPIIDVKTNLIQGFECLTRAFNEFEEVLDTESVVNSLERNGRIQELDEIVFKKMLLMMRRINKHFDQEFFLSVNASALSFNENYVEKVIQLYEQENFTKGTIVLELTESYQVDDYDYLIRLFKRLNRVGIKTAIDDFGSGYSSLSYISKFPIYAIKVDKEYVRDYKVNSFNRTLFMTLQSIAKVLDCKLVAEGVDEPDTLEFLKENNCDMYQGYYFGKAVAFDQAIKMLQNNLNEFSKE